MLVTEGCEGGSEGGSDGGSDPPTEDGNEGGTRRLRVDLADAVGSLGRGKP